MAKFQDHSVGVKIAMPLCCLSDNYETTVNGTPVYKWMWQHYTQKAGCDYPIEAVGRAVDELLTIVRPLREVILF